MVYSSTKNFSSHGGEYCFILTMFLNDITQITIEKKMKKTNKIKLLHKLLFDTDGDRQHCSELNYSVEFLFTKTDAD